MTKMPMRRVALFTALALAPALAGAEPTTPVLTGTRLDIVATGEVNEVPDLATVGAGVVTQASKAADAMAENARRMAATIASIRKAGIADRDIQTSSLSLSPQYRYTEGQPPLITGYQASNRVTVRFHDVKKAGPILDALVAAGANQIDGPNLSIEHAETLLDQAREKAVASAKARAALYAKATGLRIKRIVAISEGSSDMPRPMPIAMMARSKAAADTSIEAGEQTLSVSLSVTFELE